MYLDLAFYETLDSDHEPHMLMNTNNASINGKRSIWQGKSGDYESNTLVKGHQSSLVMTFQQNQFECITQLTATQTFPGLWHSLKWCRECPIIPLLAIFHSGRSKNRHVIFGHYSNTLCLIHILRNFKGFHAFLCQSSVSWNYGGENNWIKKKMIVYVDWYLLHDEYGQSRW